VTPTAAALNVQPTIVGLRAGVTYAMEDLLFAILIRSGNDAARAIAEKVAGSEEAFAIMMNEKAGELGMHDTYFRTASGLPAGRPDPQYTTAEDLAKLMKYASRYEFILRTMSKKGATITGSDGRNISLRTNNRALNQWDEAPWGKTGYTREARRTFAGTDPSTEPRIVFALLQSGDLWNDIKELNDKGLELFEFSRKTIVVERSIISVIVDWVTTRRDIGRKTTPATASPNK
jgi:serine-type D-Ala-D-Ala carboxypeptidase (penicillin-binding protein 5/6)